MDERTPDTGQDLTAPRRPVTARDAAAVLGVNERTVRRAINRGEFPASKRGGVFEILPGDLAPRFAFAGAAAAQTCAA